MLNAVRYPATDSSSEWGSEILALDQLVVEAFLPKPIRVFVTSNGQKFEKEWQSLKLLEVALACMGRTEEQAKELVSSLRELHGLRNPAKAHGDPNGRRLAISSAREKYGTLRNHFRDLSMRVEKSLARIKETLPTLST